MNQKIANDGLLPEFNDGLCQALIRERFDGGCQILTRRLPDSVDGLCQALIRERFDGGCQQARICEPLDN